MKTQLFILSVLCLFSVALITPTKGDVTGYECYNSCINQAQAWVQSWSTVDQTATNYWNLYCSQLYVDYVVCLRDSCSALLTAEDKQSWDEAVTAIEQSCATNGVPLTIPPPSNTGTGGTTPIPTQASCYTDCDPVVEGWNTEASAAVTTAQNTTLCTTSWNTVRTCLATKCPTTGGYGNLEPDLTSAVSTCKDKGFAITFAPSTGGSNQPPGPTSKNSANSVNVNAVLFICSAVISSIAMLFM